MWKYEGGGEGGGEIGWEGKGKVDNVLGRRRGEGWEGMMGNFRKGKKNN